MDKRTTLVLAVLLFALLGWAIFGATPAAKVSPVPSLFLEFQRGDVRSLDVKNGRGEIRIERDGKDPERWRVVAGKALVRASSEKVETLLNDLSRLAPKNLWRASEVKPAERTGWGLDAPRVTVKIELPSGPLRADFGKQTPEGLNVYAEKDRNGDVLVVPADTAAGMEELDAASFRERFPVKVSSFDVASFSLERADGLRLEAVRSGDNTWEATAPWKGAVDPEGMEKLLAVFLGAEVKEFAADGAPDLDRYGLLEPRARIRMRRRGREAATEILVGGSPPQGGTWFTEEGEPSVYVGDARIGAAVDALDPASLRDRNALRLGWARLDAIEYTAGADSWRLLRVGDRWDLERPHRVPAEAAAVEGLHDALRKLEVVRFLDDGDPEALGLADAAGAPARLQITGTDADSSRDLLLGRKDADGRIPARLMPRAGRDAEKEAATLFLLDGAFLDELAGGALRFRSREAWHIDLEEVVHLARTVGERTEKYLYSGHRWAASDQGPAPDSEALDRLLARLLEIHGTAWVGKASEAPPAWGLGAPPAGPVLRIGLRKPDGAVVERTLTLGAAAEDGGAHYATVDGTDLVFRLPDQKVDGAEVSPLWDMLTGPLSKDP